MPQLSEKVLCEARVIAMGEEVEPQNDLYLSLKMLFLTSEENLNHIEFQTDFIDGVVEDQQKLVTMPIVVDMATLLAGKYDKLTHKYKNGKFGTNQIGGFYKFEKNQNGNISELIAYGRIWKRDEKVISALEELYESENGLSFSYECLIGKYVASNGKKVIPKDELNSPIGSAVVSFPAVLEAKALMLAESLEQELLNQEGGAEVLKIRDINRTVEDMFAETKYYVESAELDLSQIRTKICAGLKKIYEPDWYDYDIINMFLDYVIVQNYRTGDYYKIAFSINDNEVVLSEPVKVNITFLEIVKKEEEQNMSEMEELEAKITAHLAEIDNLKNQISEKEAELAEKAKALEVKDAELAMITDNVNTLSASVLEKDKTIEELQAFKSELDVIKAEKEKAEIAEKKTVMTEKYSKLLTKEVIESPEIAEAINNLNESVLQAKVTEIALIVAEKNAQDSVNKKPYITATRITADLGTTDLVSKYVTRN